MPSPKSWYYRKVVGPLDELAVHRLVASGEITPNTLVSTNGTDSWLAAHSSQLGHGLNEDMALQKSAPEEDVEQKLRRLSEQWRATSKAIVSFRDEYENRVADAIYSHITKSGFGGRNFIGRTMGQLYAGQPYGGSQPPHPEFAPLQESEIGKHPSLTLGSVIAGQFIARKARNGAEVRIIALSGLLARPDMRDDELERVIAPEFRHVFTYALVREGIFRPDYYRLLEELARKRKLPGERGESAISGLTYFEAAKHRCVTEPAEIARLEGRKFNPPTEARIAEYAVALLFRMEAEPWPPH